MSGGAIQDIRDLYEAGTLAGLSERQLLDRFAASGDDRAFAALVARFGPGVLAACRRRLRDPADADDAFQATFLVLARKAGAIRDADRLGPWLYGVALRVSGRARALAARRAAREGSGLDAAEPAAPAAPPADDLAATLDEELARLPEAFRLPLVLCYLEGRTHEEAARALRCPVGTVRSRLARGRDRLRARLERRGLAPSEASLASALSARVAVPESLLLATATAPARLAAGGVGAASAAALSLMHHAIGGITMAKWKLGAAGLLSAGLVAGAGVLAQQAGPKPGVDAPSRPAPAPRAPEVEAGSSGAVILAEPPGPTRAPTALPGPDDLPPAVGRDHSVPESPEEVAARLEMAEAQLAWSARMHEMKFVSDGQHRAARAAVSILRGRVAAALAQLDDEIELLKLQVEARQAESKTAEAELMRAEAEVAYHDRLLQRVPGSVSQEEQRKVSADVEIQKSRLELKRIETREAELRLKQAGRRRGRWEAVIGPAKADQGGGPKAEDAKPRDAGPAEPAGEVTAPGRHSTPDGTPGAD